MVALRVGRVSARVSAVARSPEIVALALLFLGLTLYLGLLPYVDRALDRIMDRAGGTANLMLFLMGPLAVGAWLLTLLRGRLLGGLVGFILLLPLMGRAPRLVGIDGFVSAPLASGEPFIQRISVTTALLLLLGLFALLEALRGARDRPASRPRMDAFMVFLVGYACFATLSQVLFHPPFNGVLLAIGGAWQYVVFAFIVRVTVRDTEAARAVCIAIVAAILLNIAFRMVTVGGIWATSASGDFLRSGGFAFGPAIGYAGYLATSVVLTLHLYRDTPVGSRTGWALALLLITLELFLMSTRGALLALASLGLLGRWRRERGRLLGLAAAGFVALIIVVNYTPIFGTRSISFGPSVLQEPNFVGRAYSLRAQAPHMFDGYGLGHGIGHQVYEYTPAAGQALPPHNVFQSLTQETGLIAALLFTGAFVTALVHLWRAFPGPGESANLPAFIFMALLTWTIHASASGTSITYYYPYEGTLLMLALLAMASSAPKWHPRPAALPAAAPAPRR